MKQILKYIIVAFIGIISLLACNEPEEEVYYKGTFYPVTTSANDCGLTFVIETGDNTGLRTKPINPPDSIYHWLELEVQYKILTDSFHCTIAGPSVGGANKSFVKIEILKIKE
ncbi:MAG: hypothetical protein KDE33_11775 [Bacteroidetes bacterium]|nr:hypothetical protein [Bacteroidota bacterium]MCB9227703.1 hypothetical protein [Chitinophagales bacterium]